MNKIGILTVDVEIDYRVGDGWRGEKVEDAYLVGSLFLGSALRTPMYQQCL